MPATRGSFSQLLAPGLKLKTFEYLKQHDAQYPDYMQVGTMDGAYFEEQWMTGFGQADEFYEGEPVHYQDPMQGPTKRWNARKFGLAFQITEEMQEDDRYGVMSRYPKELAESYTYSMEVQCATIPNNGFSSVTAFDGNSLFNTAHNLQSGGTYANRPSTASTLSVTALQDILINFEKITDEQGLKKRIVPDTLLIPPDEQFTAQRILGSQFLPSTGNNDINPVAGRLKIVVLHHLTDTNNWFVLSQSANEAKILIRRKPRMESADDFDTGGAKFKLTGRYDVNVSDWRAWYGQNP